MQVHATIQLKKNLVSAGSKQFARLRMRARYGTATSWSAVFGHVREHPVDLLHALYRNWCTHTHTQWIVGINTGARDQILCFLNHLDSFLAIQLLLRLRLR